MIEIQQIKKKRGIEVNFFQPKKGSDLMAL
jgi:hypothetical protein